MSDIAAAAPAAKQTSPRRRMERHDNLAVPALIIVVTLARWQGGSQALHLESWISGPKGELPAAAFAESAANWSESDMTVADIRQETSIQVNAKALPGVDKLDPAAVLYAAK